jgi:hypothetical protein
VLWNLFLPISGYYDLLVAKIDSSQEFLNQQYRHLCELFANSPGKKKRSLLTYFVLDKLSTITHAHNVLQSSRTEYNMYLERQREKTTVTVCTFFLSSMSLFAKANI